MKAIMVIDVPEDYTGGVIHAFIYGKKRTIHEIYTNELKRMPIPMPYEQTDTQTVKAIKIDNCFRAGWNKCIEELEK